MGIAQVASDVAVSRPFDVFLSHNSKEKPAVERIAEKLKRDGIEPWLDKWCLTPGGNWQDELAHGLRSSSACAVFIGPSGIGDWERLEFQIATDRMAKDRSFRMFLVLLPDLPEPFDTGTLPPFLSTRTWVDLRRGVSDPRAFQLLINAVKGLAPGPEMPIEARNDVCPYRGLRAFDEEHAEFFFGRESDVQRLVEKLKTARFLTVLGPSGSGKSSVVRAGLIPALRKSALAGSDAWAVRVFTPGAHPLTALSTNLVRLNPQLAAGQTLDELTADQRSLHLLASVALADRPPSEFVVWVVDQFEEVFTLCQDETERARFISNLLYAATIPGGRSVVVLTMRADFYQKSAAYPELSTQIADHQFLVSPMDIDGLRQAISEPAWRVGLEFEPGLVETILEDVESQPGALPLLEHALLELWERRRGRLLTLEAYRESGGVEGAIAKRADTIYESFDAEQQSIVKRVMLRLTQPGEGTEDTRRRVVMSELITQPEEALKVQSVVRTMADARLLMIDSGAEAGSEVVDVSHEALIRSWPRLRRWIDEDRQSLRVQRRLTEAAQEWQRSNCEEGLLFRGARLAQTIEYGARNRAELNETEREFLAASEKLQASERRAAQQRTRRIIIGLGVALVLISLSAIYALVQNRVARRNEENARLSSREAFARELAANAIAQLPVNPELGFLLATEAAQRAHTAETEHALRQALLRSPLHVLSAAAKGGSVNAKFSPDGKNILAITGKKVLVYEVEGARSILELPHDEDITGAKYSPDGKFILTETIGEGGEVRHLWEVATGRRSENWPLGQIVNYSALSFSPDSKFLLFSSSDNLQVREVIDGSIVAEVSGEYPAFSRDGKFLMTKTPGESHSLQLYDASNWQRVAVIPSTSSLVTGATLGAISSDGSLAFVGTDEGRSAGVYDVGQKRLLRQIKTDPEALNPVFSPDGKLIVFTTGKLLRGWRTDYWREEVYGGNTGVVTDISFSPDGRFFLVTDNLAHLYDVKSGRALAEFGVASGGYAVAGAEFSSDGKYVLTDNINGTVSVWDLNGWRGQVEIKVGGTGAAADDIHVSSAALSPDGKLIVTVGWKATGDESTEYAVQVWEFNNGRSAHLVKEWRFPEANYSAEFSPDSKLVLTGGDNSVRTLEIDSGRQLLELKHAWNDPEFSSDGKLIATAGTESAQVWDAHSGQLLYELKINGDVGSVAFSPDGKLLLVTVRGRAQLWDLAAKQIVREMGEESELTTKAVFSPDGRFIMMWEPSTGVNVQMRDAMTGQVVVELRGHVDPIYSASFSPDGKYVVTTSGFRSNVDIEEQTPQAANEVRVWDVASGRTFYEFRDHGEPVIAGMFSQDGKFILATGADGTMHVYACELCAPQDELLKLAGRRSVRPLTLNERAIYLHE
ncbi:MAG TPA: TIR domain-containing protein [Pyrinomonadaceae bacterium]|jgi:WD40 repeat protein